MRLSADEYYHIGAAHLGSGKPCQDYALSGSFDGMVYATVSDGCSSPKLLPDEPARTFRTDIGARILALATAKAVREEYATARTIDPGRMAKAVALRQDTISRITAEALGLDLRDLLATSLVACVTPFGGFAHIVGDGAIALVRRDGAIIAHRCEWKNGLPAYPAYRHSKFSSFIQGHGGLDALALTEESWILEIGKSWIKTGEEPVSVATGIGGITIALPQDTLGELAYLAIFSDGVSQVDGVPDWKEAVRQLLAFKTMEGEFVKRRTIRFIKDAQKQGKGPVDDLSSAVIRLVHEDTAEGCAHAA